MIVGLTGSTASVLIDWDSGVTPKDPGDSIASCKLYLVAAGNYYDGAAYITGVHPSVSVEGIVQITYDITYTGAISFN